MRLLYTLAAAALSIGLAAPAGSQTVIPVSKFKALELRGGGRVILRHGPAQRVTLVRGSTEYSRIENGDREDRRHGWRSDNRESLVIEACNMRCPEDYEMEVEVVTPNIMALAVSGGGEVVVAGNFPRQSEIAAAANGGGVLDIRNLRASNVAAAVNGGGTILTRPMDNLAASANGGGNIRYWGDPQVATSIRGGGHVERAD